MNLHPVIMAALVPISIGILVAGMWLVRIVARRYDLSAEVQRKAVHIATGLYAMSLPWLLPQAWLVYSLLALAIIVMCVLRLPAISKGNVGAALHGVERTSWGDLMLVAAVGTLYFFSDQGNVPVLYILPLAVLTLADAAAALAGSSYGRMRYTVEDGQKSIEGSAIFFMVTWILAMISLLLLSDIPRVNVVLLSVMTAAFATLVEADSWRGFDNYFVPVGVLFLVAVHMDSEPTTLLLLALGFFAVLCLLNVYGRALLGLADHTARAYTAALFMIGAVVTPQNIILPAATLLAQTFARKKYPSAARHPDLDMLALLATVSFVALIGGLALGRTAISFYGTICAGMVAQLVMLALAPRARGLRIVLAVPVIAVLAVVVSGVIALNPDDSRWHGPLLPVIVLSLFVASMASILWPAFYHDNRPAKVGIIAALVPVASYFFYFVTLGGSR
ncbi:MAG: hypothetical protein GY789_18195 [Hyphomicrobiales bacterium]|nr:hypothetical protein [Hyphomicrobiales bacterium]